MQARPKEHAPYPDGREGEALNAGRDQLEAEAEARLAELDARTRAQVRRLLGLHRGGEILVRVRVEGGRHPRVSRDSTVSVTEYPLAAED